MMMKELSLHVLDIIQNSIVAEATFIELQIEVRHGKDWMRIAILDNGRGMDEALLERVISPFTTSRTTRKVGLGIPMFKAGAESAGGAFQIRSKLGEGTFIQAEYSISHLDRPPLGDMAETLYATIICNPDVDFGFTYTVDGMAYEFDTRQVRQVLGEEVPLNTPEVAQWIKEELTEGIAALNGGI